MMEFVEDDIEAAEAVAGETRWPPAKGKDKAYP